MHMHITETGKNGELRRIESSERTAAKKGNKALRERSIQGRGDHLCLDTISHNGLLSDWKIARKKALPECGKTQLRFRR